MDDTRSRQVIIAGAGIAGLTAALAFAERGYPRAACSNRRRASKRPAPASSFRPTPRIFLTGWACSSACCRSRCARKPWCCGTPRRLRELARVPLGEAAEARWKAPYLVAHRADLQGALLARVAREPEIQLVTGARGARRRPHPRGITGIRRRRRQDRGSQRLPAGRRRRRLVDRCAVSAGARSKAAFPANSPGARPSRPTVRPARLFAKIARRRLRDRLPASRLPPRRLSDARRRGVQSRRLHQGRADRRRLVRAKPTPSILDSAMQRHRAGTGTPGRAMPARGRRGRSTRSSRDSRWTSPDGIALIGDAAHAMTPFAAQGAAMAIEDAATLAAHVAGCAGRPCRGAGRMGKIAQGRAIAKVARRGALNHLAWHAAGPVALARNLLLKMRSPRKARRRSRLALRLARHARRKPTRAVCRSRSRSSAAVQTQKARPSCRSGFLRDNEHAISAGSG